MPKRNEIADPTFAQWLYFQVAHKDRTIAMVARWVASDRFENGGCWPHRANTLSHLADHLTHEHDGEAGVPDVQDLREAHDAWRTAMAKGETVPARIGGIPPTPAVTKRRGYRLHTKTIERIKRLGKHNKLSQAKMVEQLVFDEWLRTYGGKA